MSEKRRGLGRGLGALIPPAPPAKGGSDRPVDVFFPDRADDATATEQHGPVTTDRVAHKPDGTATAENTTAVPAPSSPPAGESTNATSSKPGQNSTTADPGNGLVPVPGASFAELPVSAITRNPRQPRQVFDEEELAELVASVKEIGILQPIVVRPAGEKDGEAAYELIMGERRWRASRDAGLERIPAIIRETSDDAMLRDALLENLHRSQLNPLEEAAAYQQLLEDFGCTHEELATRIGRSRPQISNTIRLLRLPPAVQRRLSAGVLSAGHARALLGLDDADGMDKLAQRIVNEGMSVRATEEAVALTDGDAAAPAPRRKPRAGGHHGELDELATRLADRLDTRVSISLGRSKGKLSVEFASVEDLNRILDILAPEERKAFQSAT